MKLSTIIKTSVENVNEEDFYFKPNSEIENIELFLYSLVFLNGLNKKISTLNEDVNVINPVEYNNFPIPEPPKPPKPTPTPNFPEDQLDIRFLKELGDILASYGYALANNIPVSINKNWDTVNFQNSYGTPMAIERKKLRLTKDNNFMNSDIKLPAVDASTSISKRIKNIVTGAKLR